MSKSIDEIQVTNKNREKVILRIVHKNTSVNPVKKLKSRERRYVDSRFLAMKLLRDNLNYSLHKIGSVFNKDHASALHGIRSYKNLMDVDARYRDLYEASMVSYRKIISEFPDPTLPREKQVEEVLGVLRPLLNKYIALKGEMKKIKHIVDRLPKKEQQKFKNERLFCNTKQKDNQLGVVRRP